ncbi:protein PhnA [Sinobacterium caligoides]|uniref:Protein PhnA n=1 Tax=Sinobacterium caligoides TaxID=933926 RepID=A0A3N2DGN9_9GAMM|nr:phnA protein [Sinobacterium caligoides]ROR98957.1 protein PhnA [Sinobacterium caligoides]
MSTARNKHALRHTELSLFGKDLTRRSGASCEICAATGVALSIYEVAPVPSTPQYSHCLFICATCRQQLDSPKSRDSNHWRCLNITIWSEIDALRVLSAFMLKQLSTDNDWAADLQEMLYLEAEQQAWLEQMMK